MKRIKKLVFASMLIGGGLWAGSIINTNADGTAPYQPGSPEDPIVTKSYVDQQITELVKGEVAKISGSIPQQEDELSMVPVTVPSGQTIVAAASAEFVVRSGKGIAFSRDSNGLSDLTGGKDLTNGTPVESNHLVVSPRAGRGISASPQVKTSMIVMVRGKYTIESSQ